MSRGQIMDWPVRNLTATRRGRIIDRGNPTRACATLANVWHALSQPLMHSVAIPAQKCLKNVRLMMLCTNVAPNTRFASASSQSAFFTSGLMEHAEKTASERRICRLLLRLVTVVVG